MINKLITRIKETNAPIVVGLIHYDEIRAGIY